MLQFKGKLTGVVYNFLAAAHGVGAQFNGEALDIFCPDDNEHTIFVMNYDEFMEKYAQVNPENPC